MNKLPPGITFSSSRSVPLSSLRIDLLRISRFLQDKIATSQLIQYDDWWQHDGLHFERKKIRLTDLFAYLETNKSLKNSAPDDYEVRVGISDEQIRWYLRYKVDWDENEEGLDGNFDFSVPVEWVAEVRSIAFIDKLVESDSLAFYEKLTN